MSKPTGGSAFPIDPYTREDQMGMTLRDWFAGQAMSGLLPVDPNYITKSIVEEAYALADAMIAERSREP